MRPALKGVYTLLATFFHYHHPLLPGYIDGVVPYGISLYTPDQQQRNYLFSLGMSKKEIDQPSGADMPVLGLYSMGSTSSIGQSCASDLDIWVCHAPTLTELQRAALQSKCAVLEQWVARQGMDISFFLMDEARFRQQQCGCLSHDNCGSTQHFLLLDEFYRSAVRLAGRRLLWYMVPAEQEANYDSYIQSLYCKGLLVRSDWLDLGSLNILSAEEYFGATLWQLYKSIDSPYKAVLKTLLLEAYSWEYPDTQLLSIELKKKLHQGERDFFAPDHDALDHYCMMLDKVTRYLTKVNDFSRLDLARRCFYLKVCEKLSRDHACVSWRRKILQKKVKEWCWQPEQVLVLDQRAQWKIGQVREAHNELLEAMMGSYRNLIRFARHNNLAASINPQDIGVLTRKLYATFETLPGKVSLINPQISPDLSEHYLTFIHVRAGGSNRAGWYLYNQQPSMEQIVSHQPLEYNRYLNKLVAWAYFNGLLTEKTRLFMPNKTGLQLQKLQRLVQDIRKNFPIRLLAPTAKALYSPCEIRQLAIIINLEQDPTQTFGYQVVHFDFRQMDLLSFGPKQQCLIGSVDLLYRNSWNEVRTLHFSGELAVLDALQTILGKMHQKAVPPEAVQVFCYSEHLSGLLRTRMQKLVAECIDLRLSSTCNEQGRFKALRIAGQIWGLFFERLCVSIQKLENPVEFYGAISNNKLYGLSASVDSGAISLPPVVGSFASEGITQFFFEESGTGFSIYILDENNRVEVYQHCKGDKEALVRDINLFYTVSHDHAALNSSFGHFNLPQFYQIVHSGGQTKVIPFISLTSPASLAEPMPVLSPLPLQEVAGISAQVN